jgi:murein DD-endopeptidase MepM/ murein hydrolase activator NlpD
MAAFDLGPAPKKSGAVIKKILILGLLMAVIAGSYFAFPKFEWNAPQIKLTPDSDILSLKPIEVEVTEQGTGLASFSVILTTGGIQHALVDEKYDQPVMQKKATVALTAKVSGVKEGPAVLRVSARDRSLWRFFRGNETVLEKNIIIDVTPPTLELIADDPYVNFGGAGVITYKTSADTVTSGVKIGKYFFPGYKGQTKDAGVYLVFFAHPYDVPAVEKAILVATDKAGNTRQIALVYTLKNVKYKKSIIPISDEFIQSKVTPLLTDVAARQKDPKEIFITVNHGLRKEDDDKIRVVGQKSAGKMLWSGAFSQLTNSKVEANFADARTYIYQGKEIDHAYHLGYDLSVTKHYPVEASNSGVVSFTGDLGIYGNAVIIDHGLGLATLYGHLSSIDVKEGETVKQKQIIGKTGETGLAVGDHLHFGVYLNGVAVLPIEWWDEKWIRDNVAPKIDGSVTVASDEPKPVVKIMRQRRRK